MGRRVVNDASSWLAGCRTGFWRATKVRIVIAAGLLGLCVPVVVAEPLGTPDPGLIEYPSGLPPSDAEIGLGRQLFFDPLLSANRQQSCASCHIPERGLGDGLVTSTGATGVRLQRNTPHLYNLAWNVVFGWDGASGSLEEQALRPIMNPDEMDMSLSNVIRRLEDTPDYRVAFARAFGDGVISAERIASALAAFQRTLVTRNSALDRYLAGDPDALSDAAKRGMGLFEGKARCIKCHDGPNLTDQSFHNIGVDSGDPGRAQIDPSSGLTGAFKTPGLRNVALTAPYMHDGSLASLEEVIRFYNRGGDRKKYRSRLIKSLNLTGPEIQDLVEFLNALTDPVRVIRPDRAGRNDPAAGRLVRLGPN